MKKTMKEQLEKIGKEAVITTEHGLSFNVRVIDYKNSYGRDRWRVEPVAGKGSAWVENIVFK